MAEASVKVGSSDPFPINNPPSIAQSHSRLPVQTTVVYTVCAAAWILLSDMILDWIDGPKNGLAHLGSIKGLLFVAVTAFLLYKLMSRVFKRLQRAEAELRTQEERWKHALETMGDGVWEADLRTQRASYSPKWKAMLGYADDEMGDKIADWMALIHPEDQAMVKEEMRRYLERETEIYGCEYRLRAKGGSYRWIMARGSFMPAQGEAVPQLIVGTHTDITARKSTEQQKDDALAFTKTVLSSSPSGIVVYQANGPAVVANESAARMIGTDVAGLLRQNFKQIESWRRCGLLAAAEQTLATERESMYHGMLETGFGKSVWIEAHLVPFKFEGMNHLLLMLMDETKEHQAIEKLRLMQAAVEAAPVGWVVTDSAGRIEWVNPGFTALTGYTSAEVIGHTPRILKSGQQSAETYEKMWQTIMRGEIWSGALTNKRKDGTIYHEINTIAPVRGADGKVGHFVAIKQNITEQKQLEHHLSRAQRLESIGQLATGMVHDLNNMLSPIMLALGLIRTRHADPETLAHVQMMESAAQRGAGVLRQVLTFARGVDGERTQLDPKLLIKEVADLAEETFPRQIKVRTEYAPGVHLVSGDLTQLHQVLLNLAVNARDAMPDGGVLTLHAKNIVVDAARAAMQVTHVEPGGYVSLGVRDTGSGIPAEVLEHMFEPFYTTKPHGKGTGLGLATVFGIVRSHGGFIEVDTKLGDGTDMRVLLPAVERPAEAPHVVKGDGTSVVGRGRRILVVDDETAIREVTCYLLNQRGFAAVGACDGVDGLAKFRADPPGFSAVITDLMMPNMDGYKLAAEIRRLAPRVPILASTGMSGDSPVEDEAALRDLQVKTLLHKPYAEREFFAALRSELEPPTGVDSPVRV